MFQVLLQTHVTLFLALYGPIGFTIVLVAIAIGSYGFCNSPLYQAPHEPREKMVYTNIQAKPFPWKKGHKALFDLRPDEEEDEE